MNDILNRLAAFLGLIFLAPLFLIIAIIIKLTSAGPVFYLGRRVGKDQKEFKIYKFRTMRSGAESEGPKVTTSKDSRITLIGKFLRKYKLDELPQLINILKGDMLLVGPRPEDPYYISFYPGDCTGILKFKPGITSPSSLSYRNESELLKEDNYEKIYIEDILPKKLRLDLNYFSQRNIFSDFILIIKSIKCLFNNN